MEMFKSHLKTLPQMLVSPPRPLYQELAETNEIILTREVLQEKKAHCSNAKQGLDADWDQRK